MQQYYLLFITLISIFKVYAYTASRICSKSMYNPVVALSRHVVNPSRNLNMVFQVSESNELMSFGNRMGLNIQMPTRDITLASQFISNPQRILESCWDKDKFKKISANSNTYMLEFSTILIPGLGQLKPEIEVTTKYDDGVLSLNSGNWTIRGSSGGIMKDSRFLHTFDIHLQGELKVRQGQSTLQSMEKPNPAYVIADGWVEYRVQGSKPTFFRKAPSFLLDNTIKLIQAGVQEYATTVFISRYLKSFRDYVRSGPVLVVNNSPAKKNALV